MDFSNTEIAFHHKSDRELQKAIWLFSLMGRPWLVNIGSKLGLWAIHHHMPLAKSVVKHTIFEQFCGGVTLQDCESVINTLGASHVATVLDYGGEAKHTEIEFDASRDELLKAIRFAADRSHVKVVSMKITALVMTSALIKIQEESPLDHAEQASYENLHTRLSIIGMEAERQGVSLFIDAEESWFQDVIDDLADMLMKRHNHTAPIIYNTYQMYRHDRLDYLKESRATAEKQGYILGAKLVRGAYMEKERARAAEKGYPSPIQTNKQATDRDYNAAVRYAIDHHKTIALFNATHNEESCQLLADLMIEKSISKKHPRVHFCQLYGMSDQITFNLAKAGYSAMKYVPYGQIHEVIPYLIRRSQENTSVSGDMGREYKLLSQEKHRRRRRS